jgi:hypothetical protein
MKRRQRGAVLLAVVIVMASVLSVAAVVTLRRAAARQPVQMAEQLRLAQAADALRAHALMRRCQNPALPMSQLLPCPDGAGTEGVAAAACAVGAQGWLSWRTLGLPPLRDSSGTCLWYEYQGTSARVIAAGGARPGQGRAAAAGRPVCGGNLTASSYVDPQDTAQTVVLDVALIASRCP